MNYFIQILQIVGHVLWFIAPIIFACTAVNSKDDDEVISYSILCFLTQASIVAGYLNGWNVK